jgi:hypothetical protein
MKEIKTDNYLKKEARWNDLPGDPGLPPGVTNHMIDEQFGSDEPESNRENWEVDVMRDGKEITVPVSFKLIRNVPEQPGWQGTIEVEDIRPLISGFELYDDEIERIRQDILNNKEQFHN